MFAEDTVDVPLVPLLDEPESVAPPVVGVGADQLVGGGEVARVRGRDTADAVGRVTVGAGRLPANVGIRGAFVGERIAKNSARSDIGVSV